MGTLTLRSDLGKVEWCWLEGASDGIIWYLRTKQKKGDAETPIDSLGITAGSQPALFSTPNSSDSYIEEL
jgi:hypothetical protein